MCESGGNYNALNPSSGAGGAYQMLPETYKGLGGKYAAPQLAPEVGAGQARRKALERRRRARATGNVPSSAIPARLGSDR